VIPIGAVRSVRAAPLTVNEDVGARKATETPEGPATDDSEVLPLKPDGSDRLSPPILLVMVCGVTEPGVVWVVTVALANSVSSVTCEAPL
jgi:hypothetical protein